MFPRTFLRFSENRFRSIARKYIVRRTCPVLGTHDDTYNYRERRKGDKYTRGLGRDLVNIVCKSNADFHFPAACLTCAGRCKICAQLSSSLGLRMIRTNEDPWPPSSGVMVDDRYMDTWTGVIKS